MAHDFVKPMTFDTGAYTVFLYKPSLITFCILLIKQLLIYNYVYL